MQLQEKNIGVILAGGVGSRMGLDYPKQFAKISGKTALEHTLHIFEKHPQINEIIIVAERNYYKKIEALVAEAGFKKVQKIIFGGKERTDSTLSAIASLEGEKENTKIIIHDSVRPLLSADIITQCITKLEQYNAVDVAIPATDTIVRVNNSTQEILEIPDREEYYQGQTPQAFRLGVLRRAYEIYKNSSDIRGTCDCSIVLKTTNEKIGIVLGSEENIKLTRPVDLFIADKLFQSRSDISLSALNSTESLHQLQGKVIVVFGGSYGIGSDIIQLAHQFGARAYGLSRSNGVDISNPEQVSQALEEIYQKEQHIDFIVNTAAILTHKPLNNMTQDEITQSVNINYLGAVYLATLAYPYLKQSCGSLLNFTSSSYTRGRPFYSIYSSTKAAIVNLTQALAEEWLPDRIRVNCINPHRTKTPMRTKAFGIEPDDTLLSPQTVALASLLALASNMTGNILDVTLNDERYIKDILAEISG